MTDIGDVAVATIAAVPATIAAFAAWRSASGTRKQLKGNGQGTHTEMLERVLDKTDKLKDTTDELHAEHIELADVVKKHVIADEAVWDRIDQHLQLQSKIVDQVLSHTLPIIDQRTAEMAASVEPPTIKQKKSKKAT